MPNARRSWPYLGEAASPPALTLTPDTTLNSARPLGGPLRRGTFGSVGPTGRGLGGVVARGASDFGMDRISQRDHDPIGSVPYDAVSTRVRR